MRSNALVVLSLFLVLFSVNGLRAAGQSTDQGRPTPVRSDEIDGRIKALDLGDSRLTRHFYAFQGVPGDLLVTLTSKNLNGDIDVFTAITFRPVMKITMYASPLSPEITKSFYLRMRQVLILRVEARTPNDDPGTYHLRFSGAYEPFSGGIPVAEETTEKTNEAARASEGSANRLSSVGARIEQPVTEPSPKPAEKLAEETATATPSPAAKTTPPKSPRTTQTRNARGRNSRTARSKPAPKASEQAKTEPAKTEEAKTETPKTETPEEKKPVTSNEEKSEAAPAEKPAAPEKAAPQEPVAPQPGAHLIIVENDGTKIDRPMSTVRRIVIEGGTIVIVLKSGRIERVPMSLVAKMSIEPQP